MKETQIHATLEIIDILPNFTFTGGTIEEVRQQAKQALMAKFDGVAVDNLNITDVKVVEIENRISTEDLIVGTRYCETGGLCCDCPVKDWCRNAGITLKRALAERLEELLAATPTAPKKPNAVTCSTCRFSDVDINCGPCCVCDEHYDEWERA